MELAGEAKTLLLKPALRDGGRTAVVLNASADVRDAMPTLSTLFFGDAAGRVKKRLARNRVEIAAAALEKQLATTAAVEEQLKAAIAGTPALPGPSATKPAPTPRFSRETA